MASGICQLLSEPAPIRPKMNHAIKIIERDSLEQLKMRYPVIELHPFPSRIVEALRKH